MNLHLLIPVTATTIGAAIIAVLRKRLSPAAATRILTLTAVGTALALIWAMLSLLVASLGHSRWMVHVAGWCHHLYRPESATVPPFAGAAAGALLLAGVIGVARMGVRERRALRNVPKSTGPISLIDSPQAFAYAIPGRFGRTGRILVSSVMFDSLDDDERRVLLAHERAHLRHHHHRYRIAVDLAAAAVPALRPAARHVRFTSERWADEEAVDAVKDRRLVARAIAHAALVSDRVTPSTGLALADAGVVARIEALLRPPRKSRTSDDAALVSGVAALAATIIGSTVQLHHLLTLALHACSAH